eukprot:GEMP01084538.1.p1 GENE.GEMP01084538.1~~GEMP01084538.1.p1  ORF type:complete len:223 (+),score=58.14 GEMP01084538.1:165-833(+)
MRASESVRRLLGLRCVWWKSSGLVLVLGYLCWIGRKYARKRSKSSLANRRLGHDLRLDLTIPQQLRQLAAQQQQLAAQQQQLAVQQEQIAAQESKSRNTEFADHHPRKKKTRDAEMFVPLAKEGGGDENDQGSEPGSTRTSNEEQQACKSDYLVKSQSLPIVRHAPSQPLVRITSWLLKMDSYNGGRDSDNDNDSSRGTSLSHSRHQHRADSSAARRGRLQQ